MRREVLNVRADCNLLRQFLATGRAWDLERGGLYDARSGVVNIWCSPDDKPACWDAKITLGGLRYPREYVGGLGWEWQGDDQAALYVEAAPYALLDQRRRKQLTEDTVLDQRPPDALEVEEHPEIEGREVEDGRVAAHPVVCGVRITAHVLGEKVHHGSRSPPPNG
jgi:hypothetical protein